MIRPLPLFAGLALVPAMTGPQPAEARGIVAALCSGAAVEIPIGGDAPPGRDQGPCCAKACHAGGCRKRVDTSQ